MLINLIALSVTFYSLLGFIDIPAFREKSIYFWAKNGFFMIFMCMRSIYKTIKPFYKRSVCFGE